jgi:hypothetical protein
VRVPIGAVGLRGQGMAGSDLDVTVGNVPVSVGATGFGLP